MKKTDINKGIFWCLTPGCFHVFNYKKNKDPDPNHKCPKCKVEYCLNCMTGPHGKISCAENKINRPFHIDNDSTEDLTMVKNFKECSKCEFWVEKKDEKSNWMKCRCAFEFCYQCGRAWVLC